MNFTSKVPMTLKHEIVVQLLDSFSNPVVFERGKLRLKVDLQTPGFKIWKFKDNKDGTYSGYFLALTVGTYEFSVSFYDTCLSPCPFLVNVYNGKF